MHIRTCGRMPKFYNTKTDTGNLFVQFDRPAQRDDIFPTHVVNAHVNEMPLLMRKWGVPLTLSGSDPQPPKFLNAISWDIDWRPEILVSVYSCESSPDLTHVFKESFSPNEWFEQAEDYLVSSKTGEKHGILSLQKTHHRLLSRVSSTGRCVLVILEMPTIQFHTAVRSCYNRRWLLQLQTFTVTPIPHSILNHPPAIRLLSPNITMFLP